jgi:RNA polymerase sigma-70 factor (ECF subfamily)
LHAQCFSWALTCTRGRRGEAEDVLQTTYLAIVEGRARFGGSSSLRTWLFAVIRNQARSRWRLARQALSTFATITSRERAAGSLAGDFSGADIERAQERKRVMTAWRALPARQREVLDLVFYRDLTIAEAAEVLGVALGTARMHYERAKAALRRELAEGQPPHPTLSPREGGDAEPK